MSEYKPGSIVPESGIYTVTHDPGHAREHDVTCIKAASSRPAGIAKALGSS